MKQWMLILLIGLFSSAETFGNDDLSKYSTFTLGPRLKERALAFKSKTRQKNLSDITEPNPLYRQILEAIQSSHTAIGEQLTGHLIRLNDGFDLGNQNFNGINWQKPFGNFAIGVNRQLSPDLFDDQRWIVDDTFSIFINASTYLSNLRDSGDIQISEKDLAAYAGITFKRTYRYVHFAPNFRAALVADYGKLFMSFWKMRSVDIFNLSEYEILSRTDQMSFKGGALISSPSYGGGVTVNGGVLANYNKLSKVQIQAVGPLDIPVNNEFLRISVEKEEGVQLTGQAQLQADFFKLLKITLLSYDIEYSYSESDKKYLSFTRQQVSDIQNNIGKFSELSDLLKLKKIKIQELQNYLTQEEIREKENFSSKYSALVWGGEAQRGSQTVVVTKDNLQKTFVIHHARSVRFVERITTKLAGIIFAALFKSDNILSQYLESISREVILEFESNRSAIENNDQDAMREVAEPSKLSLRIIKEYKNRSQFKKSSDWKKSDVRGRALGFLTRFSHIDSSTKNSLSSGSLKSPLVIQTVLRIEKEAIAHFNQKSREEVFDIIDQLCKASEQEPPKQEYCYKMIEGKYKAYIIPFLTTGKIHIVRLKDFLYSFNNQFDDLNYFYQLFKKDLVFTSGSLEATRSNGQIFLTYFHQGEFRGLGVIDNYIRESGMMVPAPIFNY
ncbi:MAG: hypothetical protein OHK0056_29660 [Bacteriovoracaceae bacterium]